MEEEGIEIGFARLAAHDSEKWFQDCRLPCRVHRHDDSRRHREVRFFSSNLTGGEGAHPHARHNCSSDLVHGEILRGDPGIELLHHALDGIACWCTTLLRPRLGCCGHGSRPRFFCLFLHLFHLHCLCISSADDLPICFHGHGGLCFSPKCGKFQGDLLQKALLAQAVLDHKPLVVGEGVSGGGRQRSEVVLDRSGVGGDLGIHGTRQERHLGGWVLPPCNRVLEPNRAGVSRGAGLEACGQRGLIHGQGRQPHVRRPGQFSAGQGAEAHQRRLGHAQSSEHSLPVRRQVHFLIDTQCRMHAVKGVF
mmetsp:Transcript_29325/g.85487  ORF Transcript_29325/g.85487 Transcript_29325/m.85487 type:complete len:307 (-) Transcript_29325:647-1567(-)